MSNPKNILEPARLSLTDAVSNTYRAVLKQTEGIRTRAKVRTVIAGAVMFAAGAMVIGGAVRHSHDNQRISSLESDIMTGQLRLALSNVNHATTELNHIGTSPRDTQAILGTSLRQLIDLQTQLKLTEAVINALAPRISPAHMTLHNQLLSLQGQMIAVQLRMQTMKTELEHHQVRLTQTAHTRAELVHNSPLAVALTDLEAQNLSCDHDSIQAACNGPLHAISCYAFLPGTENRSMCEAIKPTCARCNLR